MRWTPSWSGQTYQGVPPASRKAGIGSPQERCREMHQSGRVSSMPRMRLRPQSGTKLISDAVAPMAISRKDLPACPVGRSTPTNHCSVQRKIVGVLLRQSCG